MSIFGYLCPGCLFGWPFLQAQVLLSKKIVRTFSSDGESENQLWFRYTYRWVFHIRPCRRRKELDVKLVFICWLIGLWGRGLLEEKFGFKTESGEFAKMTSNFWSCFFPLGGSSKEPTLLPRVVSSHYSRCQFWQIGSCNRTGSIL